MILPVAVGATRWCPSSLAKLVYKSNFTMVYRWYIELINGYLAATSWNISFSKTTRCSGSGHSFFAAHWFDEILWINVVPPSDPTGPVKVRIWWNYCPMWIFLQKLGLPSLTANGTMVPAPASRPGNFRIPRALPVAGDAPIRMDPIMLFSLHSARWCPIVS